MTTTSSKQIIGNNFSRQDEPPRNIKFESNTVSNKTCYALHDVISDIKQDNEKYYQTVLISMDTKGTVDNIRWTLLANT